MLCSNPWVAKIYWCLNCLTVINLWYQIKIRKMWIMIFWSNLLSWAILLKKWYFNQLCLPKQKYGKLLFGNICHTEQRYGKTEIWPTLLPWGKVWKTTILIIFATLAKLRIKWYLAKFATLGKTQIKWFFAQIYYPGQNFWKMSFGHIYYGEQKCGKFLLWSNFLQRANAFKNSSSIGFAHLSKSLRNVSFNIKFVTPVNALKK